MKVTLKLARYIIEMQQFAQPASSIADEGTEVRNRLEVEFPVLRKEREDREFLGWVWSTKVETDPRIKTSGYTLEQVATDLMQSRDDFRAEWDACQRIRNTKRG